MNSGGIGIIIDTFKKFRDRGAADSLRSDSGYKQIVRGYKAEPFY